MKNLVDAVNETLQTAENQDELTESDKTYLRFRKHIEPGLIDSEFDMTPAKSAAYGQKTTRTDQPIRSHVFNGAAFASRLNAALSRLSPEDALNQSELMQTMVLFTVHDLHKTRTAQKRECENPENRDDPAMDVSLQETTVIIDTLNLDEFDTGLTVADYRACVFGTEEQRGNHRETMTRTFVKYRDWIRVMDAAANLSNPNEINQLESRLDAVSETVSLHYHRIDDTKGLTTNLLNQAIVNTVTEQDDVETIVHFHNGTVYASVDGLELEYDRKTVQTRLTGTSASSPPLHTDLISELTDEFIEAVQQSRTRFSTPTDLNSGISTRNISKGYLNIPRSVYLVSDMDTAFESVRTLIEQKHEYGFSRYSVYEKAVKVTAAVDYVDRVPQSHEKAQAVGLHLGTLFTELFYPLQNEKTVDAIRDMFSALDLDPDVVEFLAEEYAVGRKHSPLTEGDVDSECIDDVAEHLDESAESVRKYLYEDMDLHDTTRPYTMLAAILFLTQTNERHSRPVKEVLQQAEDKIMAYYRSWDGDWEKTTYGQPPVQRLADDNCEWFEQKKRGQIESAIPVYLERYLNIDGRGFEQQYSSRTKLEEYSSDSQPHVCLACNEVLCGDSERLKDYTAGKTSIGVSLGFTHLKELNGQGGEPSRVVCPLCELEMTLRNSVHPPSQLDSHYLLVAPDYFYSPADICIQQYLREDWRLGGGKLMSVSKKIVEDTDESRSEVLDEVLSVVLNTDSGGSTAKNYDNLFNGTGALGVYRLDPPRKENSDDRITDIPHGILDTYFSLLFAWVTSSRVLLTDSPAPATEFEDFSEMVKTENMPAAVERLLGGQAFTISFLRDIHQTDDWVSRSFGVEQTPGLQEEQTALTDGGAAQVLNPPGGNPQAEPQATIDADPGVDARIEIDTGFDRAFHQLASVLYLLPQRYDFDLQRISDISRDLATPFTGSKMILKGNTEEAPPTYDELVAASVLDGFGDEDAVDVIEQLAEAGLSVCEPRRNGTNYRYERLFRTAMNVLNRSLPDAQYLETDRWTYLKQVISEEVAVTADDMRQNRKTEQVSDSTRDVSQQDVETFAEIFVDELLKNVCNGRLYELRRNENEYASGYNAALRRRHHEKQFRRKTS